MVLGLMARLLARDRTEGSFSPSWMAPLTISRRRLSRPIYEEVRDNLRRLMVNGAIQEGEKLPSVRSLASNLAINPNTIQRAYESLEAEGYVYSIPGKGSFAAPRTGVDEERRDRLLGQFDSLTAELLYLGVTRDRLIARIREKGGEVQ